MESTGNSMPSSPNMKLINVLHKKWDECSVEEKLDKMREEMRQFNYLTQRMYAVEADVSKIKNHTHDNAGGVVVPIIDKNAMFGIGGIASRQSYLD